MALIVHYHTAVPASKRTSDATTHKTKDCGCGGKDKTVDAPTRIQEIKSKISGSAGIDLKRSNPSEYAKLEKELTALLDKQPDRQAKDAAYSQKLTRDAGEPVNAAWLKLDRMTPDSLAREARAKGIKDETKTGQVMGILRAQFKPVQIEAWSQHF